jgi:chitinase
MTVQNGALAWGVLSLLLASTPWVGCAAPDAPEARAADGGGTEGAGRTDDDAAGPDVLGDAGSSMDGASITGDADALESATRDSGSRGWITGDYSYGDICTVPPSQLDYAEVSHIMHFHLDIVDQSPYWAFPCPAEEGAGMACTSNAAAQAEFETGAGYCASAFPAQADLIRLAHASGVKVFLAIQSAPDSQTGIDPLAAVTLDSGKLQVMVSTILTYAQSRGYDGIDLDWEPPASAEGFIALMTALRAGLDAWSPRGLLATDVYCQPWSSVPFDVPTLNADDDQVNLMCYNLSSMQSAATGYNAPLDQSACSACGTDQNCYNIADMVPLWLAAGLDKRKMGLGVPFYGWKWSGYSAPCQKVADFGAMAYVYQPLATVQGLGLQQNWDGTSQVPWSAGTDSNGTPFFLTYDDARSIQAKAEFAQQQGLGGMMIWSLFSGFVPQADGGSAQPLLDSLATSYWQ